MLEHEIIPRTSKFNIFFRKIYSNDKVRNQKFQKIKTKLFNKIIQTVFYTNTFKNILKFQVWGCREELLSCKWCLYIFELMLV